MNENFAEFIMLSTRIEPFNRPSTDFQLCFVIKRFKLVRDNFYSLISNSKMVSIKILSNEQKNVGEHSLHGDHAAFL